MAVAGAWRIGRFPNGSSLLCLLSWEKHMFETVEGKWHGHVYLHVARILWDVMRRHRSICEFQNMLFLVCLAIGFSKSSSVGLLVSIPHSPNFTPAGRIHRKRLISYFTYYILLHKCLRKMKKTAYVRLLISPADATIFLYKNRSSSLQWAVFEAKAFDLSFEVQTGDFHRSASWADFDDQADAQKSILEALNGSKHVKTCENPITSSSSKSCKTKTLYIVHHGTKDYEADPKWSLL